MVTTLFAMCNFYDEQLTCLQRWFFLFVRLEKRKFKTNSFKPVVAQKYCDSQCCCCCCCCYFRCLGFSFLLIFVHSITQNIMCTCVKALWTVYLRACISSFSCFTWFADASFCKCSSNSNEKLPFLKQLSQIYRWNVKEIRTYQFSK